MAKMPLSYHVAAWHLESLMEEGRIGNKLDLSALKFCMIAVERWLETDICKRDGVEAW